MMFLRCIFVFVKSGRLLVGFEDYFTVQNLIRRRGFLLKYFADQKA